MSHIYVSSFEIRILANLSLDGEEEPHWHTYLRFLKKPLRFLKPYGADKVGFFVHAMICTLGVWGYLEKYHPNEGWNTAWNGDEASIGDLFRFIAQLDESAMIPWTELNPDNVTRSSITTHSDSSASESMESSPPVEYPDIRYLGTGTSGHWPEKFQDAVWSRDGARYVLTSSASYQCEAARLVNKFNTIEVMDEIIHRRKELGGEEPGYWYDVGGPDDVRVGIFLQAALQRNI